MKPKTITIRAGRTIPHPTRSYSNILTHFEMSAELEEGEDAQKAISELRVMAEQVVHTHQEEVVHSIRTGEELQSSADRIATLEAKQKQLTAELESLRKSASKSQQGLLFGTTEIWVREFNDDPREFNDDPEED